MPAHQYETLFMLDATKVAADADAVKQQLHHILERHGAAIQVSREWNYNQKLAYPINKQKKGAFHIVYYTMESTHQQALERDFKLAEGVIFRQMTLNIEPKWQEAILGIAHNEHGKEFAVRGMQEEAAVTTDPSAIGEMGMEDHGHGHGGPRRGGRRPEPAEKHG
ncbi:MAG TPA: 30S ribosomal protein S6 [Urbifossiella sp.]|jgi:small subunit ribosomal protein S6|nr:30S ribosomal protein S6 [Urbifossiella sp.]